MEISGRKAIVVGGASGFGRATAESLAARGASVAILDRAQSDGKDVAAGIGATFHEVDVTDFAGTEQALNDAIAALGALHVIVTTAGGGIGERTISKNGPHPLESFRQSVDLNLIGTFNVSRLAAWQMSKQEPIDPEDGERPRSAVSSSTPRPSPRSRARSGRWPTPRPRPRSRACA